MTASGPGPFAKDAGERSRMAVAAAALAGLAAAVALLRPALRLAGVAAGLPVAGRIAWLAGVAAIAAGMVALYLISSRGLRGGALARSGIGVGAVAAVFAFFYAAVTDGHLQLGRFAREYFDMSINKALWPDLLRGLVNTLKLALVAETLAILVGLLIATFALSPRRMLRFPAIAYVDLVRGLPLVVLTFLIHFGLPNIGITLGEFVSPVVILTVNASAYCAEIFRAGIQSLPQGQTDAARSLGMPESTTMLFVVIPQAVRAVIPPLVSEFIALIKDTAIVIALIGFTEASRDVFGAARTAASSTFSPTPYMSAAVVYLIVTIPLARLVGRLEKRVRAKVA